ncbi:MAG TPA: cytochrome c, partial [Kofleriaceae bacterium]|nr:cytochrome c [Kofleriaceae bacterium]
IEIAGAERLADKIASPAWPGDLLGAIDGPRAERGEAVFEKRCARCHGGSSAAAHGDDRTDDGAGTDPVRAAVLGRKVGDRPLSELLGEALGKVEDRAGGATRSGRGAAGWHTTGRYVARPLTGVWATAPYLHNGSVPTLFDLLQPAAQRPKTFVVGAREYDPVKLGLAVMAPEQARAQRAPAAFTFDTSKQGNSNAGHEFGTDLSDADKRDLIEYLKRL